MCISCEECLLTTTIHIVIVVTAADDYVGRARHCSSSTFATAIYTTIGSTFQGFGTNSTTLDLHDSTTCHCALLSSAEDSTYRAIINDNCC